MGAYPIFGPIYTLYISLRFSWLWPQMWIIIIRHGKAHQIWGMFQQDENLESSNQELFEAGITKKTFLQQFLEKFLTQLENIYGSV